MSKPQAMPSVLDAICTRTRQRLKDAPPDMDAIMARVASGAPALRDAMASLRLAGTRIVAEVKRHSPSEGALSTDVDPAALAGTYARHGAAAVSVLTETERFFGSLADLDAVTAAIEAPVLCKDFMVDPRQFAIARAHGASLALLIVAALSDRELRDYREHAESLGLACLVETHDADEIRRAVASGAKIIGVNSRNLHTLTIDLAVAEALRPLIPEGAIAVAESGIHTTGDLTRLATAGYDAFLIGSSLMKSGDPGAQLDAFIAAGDAIIRPRQGHRS